MMKNLITILMITLSGSVFADEVYEQNLFATETKKVSFQTEQQFIEYLKTNMPSTYVYFQRLNAPAQKRVYSEHKENTSDDITEIVLNEYRKRS